MYVPYTKHIRMRTLGHFYDFTAAANKNYTQKYIYTYTHIYHIYTYLYSTIHIYMSTSAYKHVQMHI